MSQQSEREILHELDNALLCDVCKQDFFVFYRDIFLGQGVINPECPGCREEKSSIDEVNFIVWCERFHPELLELLPPGHIYGMNR